MNVCFPSLYFALSPELTLLPIEQIVLISSKIKLSLTDASFDGLTNVITTAETAPRCVAIL